MKPRLRMASDVSALDGDSDMASGPPVCRSCNISGHRSGEAHIGLVQKRTCDWGTP
jgi:hypothetical protein